MIAFRCRCGKQFQVNDDLAGKHGTCPQCQQAMVVPNAASAPTVAGPSPEDAPSSPDAAAVKLDFLAPAKQPDEMGRLGPYRVLKVLGEGGMGMVLLAEDPVLKRAIALKIMRPELAADKVQRQRFLREAQATAAIEHDNIVHILQVGEANGVPFIAMPFLKGEALDARLKREKRLSIAEAVRIGRETAEGLAAAYARGLIHRDIKPANLWLEAPKGRVKIVDFGLARSGAEDVQLTKTGAILGTPAFMAPEQASGKPVDGRCDLYSLGAVLYRMLSGELPFNGGDTMALLMALALETPKPVRELNPQVPPALNALVMQMLAKEPAQRPASAQAVADALAAIAEDKTQLLAGRAGGVSPLLKSKRQGASNEQGADAPRSPGRRVLAGLLFLFRQVFGLYRIPGRLGWIIKGGTVLGLLLLVLLVKPGDGPPSSPPAASLPAGPENPFTNSLGMKMVLVPKGKFLMGGGAGTASDKEVEIKHDFYLGQYELTQWEWMQVMGSNPSSFASDPAVKPRSQEELAKLTLDGLRKVKDQEERAKESYWKTMPVEQVSWEDAQEFVKRMNQKERTAGWVYRLPTEAEWEYACRGGGGRPVLVYAFDFYFEMPTKTLLPDMANFKHGAKSLNRTCKVGSYKPNRLGLYDMHGNDWEWCQDEMKDDKGASRRVDRGGSWSLDSG